MLNQIHVSKKVVKGSKLIFRAEKEWTILIFFFFLSLREIVLWYYLAKMKQNVQLFSNKIIINYTIDLKHLKNEKLIWYLINNLRKLKLVNLIIFEKRDLPCGCLTIIGPSGETLVSVLQLVLPMFIAISSFVHTPYDLGQVPAVL